MCGRFTRTRNGELLAVQFQAQIARELPLSYNVAPTQMIAVVRVELEYKKRELTALKWGLVPSWADDPKIGYKLTNARGETVATKPSFRSALRHRRCLIPLDGYYEWQATGGKKQPYLIGMASGETFALAGLWEAWEREGEVVESCCVITTEGNELMKPIHNRMPVILQPDAYDRWLDPTVDGRSLQDLLCPFPSKPMTARPVSTWVNNARHNDPQCLQVI